MKLKELRPILWTEAIDETIEFYVTKLGFACVERNDDWGWASLHRDDVGIMLARPNAHSEFERPTFTGSLYLNVEDADAVWEALRDECKVCYPIETFEWGMREFAIFDNNGYLLQFGCEIED